ncbi:hypothetical protein NW752_005925 [Fusarium irregulare]|nr:hypothetical protein NW752_005925 [Fusarium irregulare]
MPPLKVALKSWVSRPIVRTNSAAEFVELRAGPEFLEGMRNPEDKMPLVIYDEQDSTEFDRLSDRFMSKEQIEIQSSLLKPSDEQAESFKEILSRFQKNLQERAIFKKLDLPDRDLSQYDLKYVIEVAKRIKDHRDHVENTKRCRGFMQKCAESINGRRRAIGGILSMIPSDVYGSVICGGFGLILLAAETHQTARVEIQSALADIPRKLEEIKTFEEIHMPSPNLHQSANDVFIAIFAVLERIINKISKTTLESVASKLKGTDSGIPEALEQLDARVQQFKVQVDICRDRRMGRTSETMEKVHTTMAGVTKLLNNMNRRAIATEQAIASGARVQDMLYQLFASSANFNPADNTVNIRALAPPGGGYTASGTSIADAGSLFHENKVLVTAWLAELQDFDPTAYKHIEQIISGLADLEPEETDKLEWITQSDEIRQWQSSTSSTILDVRPEDAPEEDINPLSVTSAIMQLAFNSVAEVPVLSFFCGLRTRGSRHPNNSGPMALLNSLNGQLLKFLAENRSTVDLSFLNSKHIGHKSKSEPKYAFKLLDKCLQCLSRRDIVVIIIDGLSHLTGDKNTGHRVIKRLAEVVTEYPDLIIKILITDALPTCPSKDFATDHLYVPSEIDGDRTDVDLDVLKNDSRGCISELQASREQEDEGSGSGSESEEFDDYDDW